MPAKLRKLKITQVAACRQGANYDVDSGEGAHILLFKSAPAVAKENGVTTGDVYAQGYGIGSASTCTAADCHDPSCPVHGTLARARRKRKRVAKGPISAMGTHTEPDGDETPPLDYKTRGQQYDLWEQLWGKWECFCTTFYDCIGDGDEDNVAYLPILTQSIIQFGEDVEQLLVDCGVSKQVEPLLEDLQSVCDLTTLDVAKAGAAMAGHRRKRLQDAIAALQQILEECTPEDLPHGIQPPINHAGVSAADVAHYPAMSKGTQTMPLRKNAESDQEHCDSCDDDECDNPAHDRMKKEVQMAETIDGVTKRAAAAEARVKTLEARVAELEPLVAKSAELETTIAKMQQTPEEQEAAYWANVPEPVRKKHEAEVAETVALRKQLEDARAEREQTVYIAKARDYRGFGMAPEKHWRILKRIDEWPEDERDELLRLMKASAEQLRTADLFKAAGHDTHNGTVDTASATDELFAKTQAYADEKGLSFQKAADAIAKQYPDLMKRASDERRLRSRVSSE